MCSIILIIYPMMLYGHFCFSEENTWALKIIVKKSVTILSDFFEESKNSDNSYQLRIERSSCSQMFFKINSWCSRPEGLQIYSKENPTQVFRCEVCKKFQKIFFYKPPLVAASELISTFQSCINTCFVFIIHISISLE